MGRSIRRALAPYKVNADQEKLERFRRESKLCLNCSRPLCSCHEKLHCFHCELKSGKVA